MLILYFCCKWALLRFEVLLLRVVLRALGGFEFLAEGAGALGGGGFRAVAARGDALHHVGDLRALRLEFLRLVQVFLTRLLT